MTEAEKSHEIQLFWFFMVQLHETGHAVETHKHGYSHLLGIKQYFVESVSGEPNNSVPLTVVTCVKRNVEGEKLTAMTQDESASFQHGCLKSLRSDALVIRVNSSQATVGSRQIMQYSVLFYFTF